MPVTTPAWMEASMPTFDALREVRAELRRVLPAANDVQADWVWRLRQGETLTLARCIALLPLFGEEPKLLRRYATDLLVAGVLESVEPEFILAGRT